MLFCYSLGWMKSFFVSVEYWRLIIIKLAFGPVRVHCWTSDWIVEAGGSTWENGYSALS